MRRALKDWKPERVDDIPVAPHRYTWHGFAEPDDTLPWDKWKLAQPYQPGEVVYVVYGDGYRKARIVNIGIGRDWFGDRRPHYYVQYDTKKGIWSKVLTTVYPGYIQRGYQRAGLAPDVPE